jgi:hypothetical protein
LKLLKLNIVWFLNKDILNMERSKFVGLCLLPNFTI